MGQPQVTDSMLPSDAELISAVRAGDTHAYGTLFERHRDSAVRLARQLAGLGDADDLVSDAFTRVFDALRRGGGPDLAFRAYLLTAVRRLYVDKIRAASKITPTDQIEEFDPGVPFADPALAGFESQAAAKAFAALPERWQLVLWHLEVEGQKPADIAPLLGVSANSVSAMGYRAREGLRQSYLQVHVADTTAEECRWVIERLGAHVRKGLSHRDESAVDEHLESCRRCTAIYLELADVNSDLAGIIAPILLGTAAAGYLTSTGSTAGGLGAVLARTAALAKAHAGLVAGGAASVIAIAVTTVVVTHHQPADHTASDPVVQAKLYSANGRLVPPSQQAPLRPNNAQPGGRGPASTRPGQLGVPPLLAPLATTKTTGVGGLLLRSALSAPQHATTGPLRTTPIRSGPPGTNPSNPGPPNTGPISTGPTRPGPPSTAPTTTGPPTTGPTSPTGPPTTTSPTTTLPTTTSPTTTLPTTTSPTTTSPTTTSPTTTLPTTTSPTTTLPTTTSPTTTSPTTTSPTTTRPPPRRTAIDLSLSGSPLLPTTRITLHVAANPHRPTAGAVSVQIVTPLLGDLTVSGSSWTCHDNGPWLLACTSRPSATPQPIHITWSGLLPPTRVVAVVTAADNTDPVRLNNTIKWLL